MDACGLLFLLGAAGWLVLQFPKWMVRQDKPRFETQFVPDEIWERP